MQETLMFVLTWFSSSLTCDNTLTLLQHDTLFTTPTHLSTETDHPASLPIFALALASRVRPPTRPIPSTVRHSIPPRRIRSLVVVRVGVRPLRTRSPLRVPPNPIARPVPIQRARPSMLVCLILSVLEVVVSACTGAVVGPKGFKRIHELCLDRVWVVILLVVELLWREPPARPLPLLRTVTHESALVAVDGDEDIRALVGQHVFESTQSARALAVVRT